jgi:hypothetical protein
VRYRSKLGRILCRPYDGEKETEENGRDDVNDHSPSEVHRHEDDALG